MTRDEARILISSLIEWYTEDIAERLGMSMGKDEYMDALEVLWHGPEGELISRADAIEAVAQQWLLEASAESPYVSDDDIDDYRKLAEELLSDIPSAEAVQGYTEWLEKIIVMLEPEYLCEDTTDKEWCEENCHHSSIQAECLRHLYEAEQVTSKLESAEAVQGEWIMHIDDLFPEESTQECSNCHEHETIKICNDNYCPNCGARMKGGDTE